MTLTRRELVLAALASGGLYRLVDGLAVPPARAAGAVTRPAEQHLLGGLRVVVDNGVEVLVPPLHHQVVTARVKRVDRAALEEALRSLERRFPATPAGLGITLAWGLPYFRRHVGKQAERYLPFDRRARRPALLDAIRFPSDPEETILERNDLAVLLRSDRLEHVNAGAKALFDELDLFEPTSIRRGFAGGGFAGNRSLPKRMAVAAGVPGADLIPDRSELFLGFTSTQKAGLGPGRIANLETLGYARIPGGYFRGGTHMHLSHLLEDLLSWYATFTHQERIDTSFKPGLQARPGTLTVHQGPADAAAPDDVVREYGRSGAIGHSASIQTASRLDRDTTGADGTVYPRGTAVPQRADFNTLDNPFFWSATPLRDRMADGPAAGLHFVVFNPTSDDFHRVRLAMDGILPGGTRLPFKPRARGQGFNSVLRTTHRQNFLVPPRAHRAFPLSELPT